MVYGQDCFVLRERGNVGIVSVHSNYALRQRIAPDCFIHSTDVATSSKGTSQVVCWCSKAREVLTEPCTLMGTSWLFLDGTGILEALSAQTADDGILMLFLGGSEMSKLSCWHCLWALQLQPSSAAHISFPSGPMSQHEMSSFLGL